jgi:glycosyltransferase involved in cell wall biosynthesis
VGAAGARALRHWTPPPSFDHEPGEVELSRITIVIPFHSGLGYLREATLSVLAQSSPAWRLLVLDDSGSSDRAEAVAELVSSFSDDRIEARHNARNLGMVENWNLGIDASETELVSLLHGDDRLLPGYVALMLELADRHPDAVAFYCGARIIGASGRRVLSLPDMVKRFFLPRHAGDIVLSGERAATALMSGNFIMCPTLCFRKPVLGSRRFAAGWSQAQDLELTTRLLMDGESLVGSRQAAYAYRRHAESATALHSRSRLRFDEEFRLFDQVAGRAEALGWERTARVSRRKRIVVLHLLYRSLRELSALRLRDSLATLRYLRSRRRSRQITDSG